VPQIGTNVLSSHFEVLSNLLDASRAVRREVYLRSSHAIAENLLYLSKVLISFGPQREGVRSSSRSRVSRSISAFKESMQLWIS